MYGLEPEPANALTVPTCVPRLPFNFANNPVGKAICSPLIAELPSGLVSCRLNGENAPAAASLVPAAIAGEKPPRPGVQSVAIGEESATDWPPQELIEV